MVAEKCSEKLKEVSALDVIDIHEAVNLAKKHANHSGEQQVAVYFDGGKKVVFHSEKIEENFTSHRITVLRKYRSNRVVGISVNGYQLWVGDRDKKSGSFVFKPN